MARHFPKEARVTYDGLGSIVGTVRGAQESPRVMLAAHMDEIGFMVKEVTKEGFLKILPLGGWWSHTMLAQRVVVRTRKGDVIGVVGSKPPHGLPEEERKKLIEIKDMVVDVGGTKGFEVSRKLGIRPGDPVVPWSPFTVMANDRLYLGKAWDDRVGCAVVVEALRRLIAEKHPNTVFGVGTVQEEVGLRGAETSGHFVQPDVAFALDVSLARDIPGMDKDSKEVGERLGGGPAILVYDRTMLPNLKLRDLAVKVAERKRIPYHFATVEGGYDTGRIHLQRSGVPCLVLGIPTRYIHSHLGIIDRHDVDQAVRLLVELIKVLDKKTVAGLTAR
jgi:endoglucanase